LLECTHVGMYIYLEAALPGRGEFDIEQAAARLDLSAAEVFELLERLAAVGLIRATAAGVSSNSLRLEVLPPLSASDLRARAAALRWRAR
jgi:DNA-binding Lrp family transcriptional regulator